MFREKRAQRGLGDLVETAVKPIAKALKLDCLDEREPQTRKQLCEAQAVAEQDFKCVG
jgi:hypothetical protein